MLLLSRELKAKGHAIAVICHEYEEELLRTISSEIYLIPKTKTLLEQNEYTLQWLKKNGNAFSIRPDSIIVSGSSFLSSLQYLRDKSNKLVFFDQGMQAFDNDFSDSELKVYVNFLELRRKTLSYAHEIVCGSTFIRDSQTIWDTENAKIRIIYNPIGYLEEPTYLHNSVLELIEMCRREEIKVVIVLERSWEENKYKNSLKIIEILQKVHKSIPNCIVFVLSDPNIFQAPPELEFSLIPIGHPSDTELVEILKKVDLCISLSTETLNLSLLDAQSLKKPVLALDVTIHPEIILHPWYLCKSYEEMVWKWMAILNQEGPDEEVYEYNYKKFLNYFQIENFISNILLCLENTTSQLENEEIGQYSSLLVFIDISFIMKENIEAEKIEFIKELYREFQYFLDPILVIWNKIEKEFVLPQKSDLERLQTPEGPRLFDNTKLSSDKESRISLSDFLRLRTFLPSYLFTVHKNNIDVQSYAQRRNLQLISFSELQDNFTESFWPEKLDRKEYLKNLLKPYVRKREYFYGKKNVILYNVTNTISYGKKANSGIPRVTRSLARELQKKANILFVTYLQDEQTFRLLTKEEMETLSLFEGPLMTGEYQYNTGRIKYLEPFITERRLEINWIVIPEVLDKTIIEGILSYAKNHQKKVASIFYDAIPVHYPELCHPTISGIHSQYMKSISACNTIVSISTFSNTELLKYYKEHKLKYNNTLINLLPGEQGTKRETKIQSLSVGDRKTILCVSTLEPRKNHKTLIEACLFLEKQHPELDWILNIVGSPYVGAEDISAYVESVCRYNSKIKWLKVIDESTLKDCYKQASITVYPSFVEGYGLPIMESLWYGKPCICYKQGVMSELAKEGGCLTTDVMNPQTLADAIYQLLMNTELYRTKSEEAIKRKIKTWEEYALEFLEKLEFHKH